MARIKYYIGITIAVLAVIGGAVYVYAAHFAPQKPDKDTSVSVWYVNADKMWNGFTDTVKEYNKADGEKYGVTVNPKGFSSDAELYDAVDKAIDKGDKLPEMIVCDTDFSAYLKEKDVLADMDEYFGKWEISDFDKDMLAAADSDGGILAVPVAAETDVFLVNTKCFPDMNAISGFEKLAAVSKEYYGRNETGFFTITDYSRFFRTAMAQLADEFDAKSPHDTQNENCKYIYKLLADTAYYRGLVTSASAAKDVAEGKLACAIVSSADIMQCADELEGDNISFETYPCLKDGKSVYVETVTGVSILKSDKNGEKASALFLKWFASKDVNSDFVGDSGYISALSTQAHSEYKVYDKLMSAVKTLRDNGTRVSFAASARYSEDSRNFNNVLQSIMSSLS